MTPIPDAQAGPVRADPPPKIWVHCPDCGATEHTFTTPGFRIYQVCCACGSIGPDLHWLAEEGEKP